MSDARYTPGPWGIEQTKTKNWIGPMRKDGKKVNTIVTWNNRDGLLDRDREISDANARLMAAAPELLRALIAVVRVANRATVEFDDARAIIAKAEGRAV